MSNAFSLLTTHKKSLYSRNKHTQTQKTWDYAKSNPENIIHSAVWKSINKHIWLRTELERFTFLLDECNKHSNYYTEKTAKLHVFI